MKTPEAALVTASSGNHGIAVATAAVRHGMRLTVLVGRSVSPAKLERLRRRASGAAGPGRSLPMPSLRPADRILVLAPNFRNEPYIAYLAARTKRVRIGMAVAVLPLAHPLRIAEEVATVDQISHGRLIFGVGRSGFPRTYEAYGVPYGESRDRFAETLEILKRAWTEESFSYKGQYYSFDNVKVTPNPKKEKQ